MRRLIPSAFVIATAAMLAGCAQQTFAQQLATPAGQADPLGTTVRAGYMPGTENYAAVNAVLAAGVRPNDPDFPKAVDRQIAAYELQVEMAETDPAPM